MKIVLQNVTKIFPSRNKKSNEEVVAVNDFNIEVPDGKLIGLLGPSGCGKSTTLYMISGLQTPTKGKIFFGEDDVTVFSLSEVKFPKTIEEMSESWARDYLPKGRR